MAYRHALDLHRAGKLNDAAHRLRDIVTANPRHLEATHALGVVLNDMGQHETAERLLRRAAEGAPANPAFLGSLGMVEAALGRPADAVKTFRTALRRDPDSPALSANLGIALLATGEAQAASQALRKALRFKPDLARAHAGLGRALLLLSRLDEAEASLRRAIELQPDNADAEMGLGEVLAARGESEEALQHLTAAAQRDPEHTGVRLRLAATLSRLGRHAQAANNYRAAAFYQPSGAAYLGLGRELAAMGQPDEALAALRLARRLAPDDAEIVAALSGQLLANELGDDAAQPVRPLSDLEREEARQRLAVEVTPDNAVALGNLANALGALGRLDEAVDYNRRALAVQPDYFYAWSNLLFSINYLGDMPVGEMVAEAKRFGAAVEARIPARSQHANSRDPARRLRVGLVSADLKTHPVGRFLDAPLAAMDRQRIELVAYADTTSAPDELTQRLKPSFTLWRDIAGLDDETVERQIVADRVDILLDMAGHTGASRLTLFARKPAPIAVTWLGYFATTGLRTIDYVLATKWVIPEAERDQWVEAPWYLPETYLCFSAPKLHVPVAPPPVLHNGYVTFGSANNINKLNVETAACWAGVLRAVPDSRLLLRSRPLADAPVADRVHRLFAAQGIAADRLILQGAVSDYGRHLAAYGDVDIALDPFPYAGGTTSMEALWMGVPVLTLRGDRYVAHMGENILNNLGMAEWIAADAADYAARAAGFAADARGLAALRQELRHRVSISPLCDAPRFAQALEQAFRGMWETWCVEHKDG